jgi:hypothetical protein
MANPQNIFIQLLRNINVKLCLYRGNVNDFNSIKVNKKWITNTYGGVNTGNNEYLWRC